MTKPNDSPSALPKTANVGDLVNRAEKGDVTVLPSLVQLLQTPALVDQMGGNLALHLESSLVAMAAGKHLILRAAITRKLELLWEELAGPSPTPLERLLVERVAACWLHLHYREIIFQQATDLTIPQADYHQQLIDRAQRHYLAAIKTLATIRKLALPALQVNIAGTQVNVAG